MIRFFTLLGSGCLIAAIGLAIVDAEKYAGPSVGLLLASFVILGALGVRRGYHKAHGIVSDARKFMSGDIQQARIVSVGEPKGFFSPEANVVLELEGEDGTKHQFDRDLPVPWPFAIMYRLGKRFSLPLGPSVSELVAVELKREGLNVSVSRPPPAAARDAADS